MTAGGWTTVRITQLSDRPEVIRTLFALGADGVQELDAEVITHLRDARPDVITAAVRAADEAASVEMSATPDVDWSAEWKSRINAHRVGRLVVCPPWHAEAFSADERIVIDPGMAFGTGEHETTRGVLRLMQNIVRGGDTVVDLGAGSAVLAIAAARLGARRAIAVELDPDAIGNAEENVRRNEVDDRVTVIEGDAAMLLPLLGPVRVVVANIISSVLVMLLPTIAAALTGDGQVILSGILLSERPDIERALEIRGWRVIADDAEGLWWSVAVARA